MTSYIVLKEEKDVLLLKKFLSQKVVINLLNGIFNKKKYIYYPEIETIVNTKDNREIYFLKKIRNEENNEVLNH